MAEEAAAPNAAPATRKQPAPQTLSTTSGAAKRRKAAAGRAAAADPPSLRELILTVLPRMPSFFYRSTLRARVRAIDPVKPARRFDTKEEWKTVLDELHKKGKLIYNAEGRDDITLPTATPPAGDAGPS